MHESMNNMTFQPAAFSPNVWTRPFFKERYKKSNLLLSQGQLITEGEEEKSEVIFFMCLVIV